MRVGRYLTAAVVVGSCVVGLSGRAQTQGAPPAAPAASAAQTPQKPGDKFDPKRDADADIQAAVGEAKKSKRRIILDVGGEWCSWCHILDRYFADHQDLLEQRDRLYVWTKINFSPENKNETLLSKYPKIPGYPHLFVLDQEGKLVQSQGTSELEEGPSYNYDRMQQFLNRWSGSSK